MQLTLSELKIPLSGAALALVTGILLGGAMQPQLIGGDARPSGPQMFADWAGARSTGPFDPGTTFASYHGAIPDYVMGTDWKRRMTWPDERAAVSAPREEVRADDLPAPDPLPEHVALTRAAYEEPPAPAHDYPSLGGARPAVIEVPAAAPDEADPDAGGA